MSEISIDTLKTMLALPGTADTCRNLREKRSKP